MYYMACVKSKIHMSKDFSWKKKHWEFTQASQPEPSSCN